MKTFEDFERELENLVLRALESGAIDEPETLARAVVSLAVGGLVGKGHSHPCAIEHIHRYAEEASSLLAAYIKNEQSAN